MNLPFDYQLMCYKVGSHAVAITFPLPFPGVFRNFEAGNDLSQKLEVG